MTNMQTTGLTQAKYIKNYRRNAKHNPIVINASSELLPREVFEGHAELLAEYDDCVTLKAQINAQNQLARKKAAAATAARTQYAADVLAALKESADPSTIKNTADQLEAEATAHRAFAQDASSQASRAGIRLSPLIEAALPACFAGSEKAMADAADEVRSAVAAVSQAYAKWAKPWAIRNKLSQMHVVGGQQHSFSVATALPPEVTEALSVLENLLSELDQLKADENEISKWRADQAKADATSAAAMAKPAPRPLGNLYAR